eukprot:2468604-Alexandrium_andersonii.AAC.1
MATLRVSARGGSVVKEGGDALVLAAREQARIASLGGSFAKARSNDEGGWQDRRLAAQGRVIADLASRFRQQQRPQQMSPQHKSPQQKSPQLQQPLQVFPRQPRQPSPQRPLAQPQQEQQPLHRPAQQDSGWAPDMEVALQEALRAASAGEPLPK